MARIYVACLASYNNGVLHGKWIDASSDVDEMQAEIDKVLLTSPFPNVMVPSYEAAARAAGHTDLAGYDTWQELCEDQDPEIEPIQVPSAEEWAMHDFEGLPEFFGEYPQLKDIARYVELLEDNSEWDEDDILAVVNDFGDLNYATEAITNNYIGKCDSFREYADQLADDVVISDTTNQTLINYFDYAAFARDLRMDYTVVDTSDGVLIFRN